MSMALRRSTTPPRKRLLDPQASCGREISTSWFRRKKSWWPCGAALDKFDSEIEEDLENHLRNVGLGYADIYLRLYMLGTEPAKANPIIMVCCSNKAVREEAEGALRRSRILDRYPEFGLGKSPLPLEQPTRAGPLAADVDVMDVDDEETDSTPRFPEPASKTMEVEGTQLYPSPVHQLLTPVPLPSVGRMCYLAEKDGKPSRAATLGYIIQLCGSDELFQIMPGHITDVVDPSAASSAQPDFDLDDCQFDGDSDDEDIDETATDRDDVALRQGSATPPIRELSCEESGTEDTQSSRMSSSGGTVWSPPPPMSEARDSVLPKFELRKPRDLFSIGAIQHHCQAGGNPGLDYAFARVSADAGPPCPSTSYNVITLRGVTASHELQIRDPIPIGKDERRIIAVTASGGVTRGVLIPGATYFRKADHSNLQRLYFLHLEGVVVEGDCGAAVVDEETGALYGHIVRGCSGTGVAYIVAATEVFADLRARLGQDVLLAGLKNRQKAGDAVSGGQDGKATEQPSSGSRVELIDLTSLDTPSPSASLIAVVAEQATPCEPSTPKPSSATGSPRNTPSADLEFHSRASGSSLDRRGQPSQDGYSDIGKPGSGYESYHGGEVLEFRGNPNSESESRDGSGNKTFWPTDMLPQTSRNPHVNLLDYGYNADIYSKYDDKSVSLPTPSGPSLAYSPYLGVFQPPEQRSPSSRAKEFVDPSLIQPDFQNYPGSPGVIGSAYPASPMLPAMTRQQSISPYPSLVSPQGIPRGDSRRLPMFGAFGPPTLPSIDNLVTAPHAYSLPIPSPFQPSYALTAGGDEGVNKVSCPHPDCGKVFKDLKAHMLTHQAERPEKCPIVTCEYHVKGFARKYDKNRHTLTHYKGTLVCGFCPDSGSSMEKSFNRADVFKRHLTSVHSVEQHPPNSRRRKSAAMTRSLPRKTGLGWEGLGKCSTCERTFEDAQLLYDHLDDCVLKVVQTMDGTASTARFQASLEDYTDDIQDTLRKHALPAEKTQASAAQSSMTSSQEAKRRRRRESHNSVERRRRDNINERIQDLAKLAPIQCLEDERIKKAIPNSMPLSPTSETIASPAAHATSVLDGSGAADKLSLPKEPLPSIRPLNTRIRCKHARCVFQPVDGFRDEDELIRHEQRMHSGASSDKGSRRLRPFESSTDRSAETKARHEYFKTWQSSEQVMKEWQTITPGIIDRLNTQANNIEACNPKKDERTRGSTRLSPRPVIATNKRPRSRSSESREYYGVPPPPPAPSYRPVARMPTQPRAFDDVVSVHMRARSRAIGDTNPCEEMTEKEMREALSDYVIYRFEKIHDKVSNSWDDCVRKRVTDISRSDALRQVGAWGANNPSVIDKKKSLMPDQQRQLDLAMGDLVKNDADPQNFQYELVQIGDQLKQLDASHSRRSDRRTRKKMYECISLTACFKRSPRPGVDIAKMYERCGRPERDPPGRSSSPIAIPTQAPDDKSARGSTPVPPSPIPAAAARYACKFPLCPFTAKRESNCKQHMRRFHGWKYVRTWLSPTRYSSPVPPSPIISTGYAPLKPLVVRSPVPSQRDKADVVLVQGLNGGEPAKICARPFPARSRSGSASLPMVEDGMADMDSTKPLANFFISSSHNTYLEGRRPSSPPSADTHRKMLESPRLNSIEPPYRTPLAAAAVTAVAAASDSSHSFGSSDPKESGCRADGDEESLPKDGSTKGVNGVSSSRGMIYSRGGVPVQSRRDYPHHGASTLAR